MTRLAADVLAPRLADQLNRVGQRAPLAAVTVRVVLPARDVLGLAAGTPVGSDGRHLTSFGAELAVHTAVSQAVRAALERPGTGPANPVHVLGASVVTPLAEPEAGVVARPVGDRLALAVRGTLLAAWRQGRLRQLLGRCEPALLAHWAGLAAGQPAREPAGAEGLPAGAAGSPSAAVANAAFEAFLDVLAATAAPGRGRGPEAADSPSADAADAGFEAIAGVLAATARAGPRPGPERHLAPEAADSPSPGAADATFEAITGALTTTAGARPWPEPRLRPEAGAVAPGPDRLEPAVNLELEVASILPFLLVGPLDDLGVLDAVTAALAGPGGPDLMAAFAACLARKVLPAPGAGWLQPAEVTAAVAAFTGQAHAPDGSACERLGRAVTSWWPVVQEVLGTRLAGLRAEGTPLVASPSPGGVVIADADGLMPLAWDADADAARRLWEDCGRPPVLVHRALAAGWQASRPVPDRVHTRPLAELVALAGRRPASGRAGLAPELEAPTGLLAGVGLATLAWELWHRHGELTHPALAIGRLGDLGGRIRLGPDSVTVQMPVGRRHADLRDSGLLRTVDDVPWLQGRRLELLGG